MCAYHYTSAVMCISKVAATGAIACEMQNNTSSVQYSFCKQGHIPGNTPSLHCTWHKPSVPTAGLLACNNSGWENKPLTPGL